MIAHDTGHTLADETTWGVHNPAGLLAALNSPPVVAQCPALFKWVLDRPTEEVFVVLVRRNLEEIYRSQERIAWGFEFEELSKFGFVPAYSGGHHLRAAEIKYAYWDWGTKPPLRIEIAYDDLRNHPLWVNEEERKNFTPKQTKK